MGPQSVAQEGEKIVPLTSGENIKCDEHIIPFWPDIGFQTCGVGQNPIHGWNTTGINWPGLFETLLLQGSHLSRCSVGSLGSCAPCDEVFHCFFGMAIWSRWKRHWMGTGFCFKKNKRGVENHLRGGLPEGNFVVPMWISAYHQVITNEVWPTLGSKISPPSKTKGWTPCHSPPSVRVLRISAYVP